MNEIEEILFKVQINELIYEIEDYIGSKLNFEEVADYLISKGVTEIPEAKTIAEMLSADGFSGVGEKIEQRIVSEDTIFPSGLLVKLEKKKYKIKGEIWDVHLNDVDPFPSSPHAHNYHENLVMHLGNGKLYRKREYVATAKRKQFLKLREMINHVELPELEI